MTHPSGTPKSPVAFTALNPTLLSSVTEEPLLSSSMEPHTSGTTEIGFSMTSKVFQATRVPGVGSGFPWSTGSADSATRNVFRTISFKADTSTDDLNPDILGNLTSTTTSLRMGSDVTRVSLSNPLFSPHPEQFMDLTNARETSTVMP